MQHHEAQSDSFRSRLVVVTRTIIAGLFALALTALTVGAFWLLAQPDRPRYPSTAFTVTLVLSSAVAWSVFVSFLYSRRDGESERRPVAGWATCCAIWGFAGVVLTAGVKMVCQLPYPRGSASFLTVLSLAMVIGLTGTLLSRITSRPFIIHPLDNVASATMAVMWPLAAFRQMPLSFTILAAFEIAMTYVGERMGELHGRPLVGAVTGGVAGVVAFLTLAGVAAVLGRAPRETQRGHASPQD